MSRPFFHRLSVTLLCLFAGFQSAAQDIVLNGKTSDLTIEGKLVEFDGEFYQLETDLGVLTVDGRTVTCQGDACPEAVEFVSQFAIAGPVGLGDVLMPSLIEAFALTQGASTKTENLTIEGRDLSVTDADGEPMATIAFTTATEIDAYAALAVTSGLIVATTRAANQAEARAIADNEGGDIDAPEQRQTLAHDAVVAMVSPINPVSVIALADLRGVFSGQITNWRDIGGPDADINLYIPRGVEGFDAALLDSPLGLDPSDIPDTATTLSSLGSVSDLVAADPFGIALTSFANIRGSKPLGLRGTCGLVTRPSAFNVKSGAYPMAYAHQMTFGQERLPLFAREFLTFAGSDLAYNVVSSLGYIDLGITTLDADRQGLRMIHAGLTSDTDALRPLLEAVNGAEQLSLNLQFEDGSATLSATAAANIAQLASELSLGNFADKEIALIGFDAAGESGPSERRAAAVRDSLLALTQDAGYTAEDFTALSMGGVAPIACDDDPTANNRVEIWVRDRS